MRWRGNGTNVTNQTNENVIRKVLEADNFEIHQLKIEQSYVRIDVTNYKFRSTAQAIGRIASTLQRFTSDDVEIADIALKGAACKSEVIELT